MKVKREFCLLRSDPIFTGAFLYEITYSCELIRESNHWLLTFYHSCWTDCMFEKGLAQNKINHNFLSNVSRTFNYQVFAQHCWDIPMVFSFG